MEIVDLSVCLPIYYGAKINDVEKCLDSLYLMCENINRKYEDKIINFLIGIDNSPKKFNLDKSIQKNKTAIKDRIIIFKKAIKNLNSKFNVDYFITENNVRVSVMRNIMISKTQNSKYITFIDHDDQMKPNTLNIIYEVISNNQDKKVICFKCINTCAEELAIFEIFGPWSVLYNPEFLLKNNIAFIPDIPLEDRFFRRETELYLISEEKIDLEESFYLHNKEGRSGLLPSDLLSLIRQEVYKRVCYKQLKIKTYCIIRNGLDETFYKEYVYTFDEKNRNLNSLYNNVFNSNNFINKKEANNFAFADGKKLNKYPKENHFTLCRIYFNDTEEQIYCRGRLCKTPLKTITDLDKINQLITFLEYDSEDFIIIFKYIDKYINISEFNMELINISKTNIKEILNKLIKKREEYISKLILNKDYKNLQEILNIQDKNIDLSFINYNQISDIKIKNIIDNYLFYNAYEAIINENLEKLKEILSKYPDIINIQNQHNKINLSNLACRYQSIQTNCSEKIISKFKDENNKIIAFLLKNFPSSFTIKDIYKKSALDFLLVDYIDNLRFNNNFSLTSNKLFFENVEKLEKIFKEEFYTVIPYLRYIFNNGFRSNNKNDILEEFKQIKNNYIKENLIGLNIINAYKNNDYKLLESILINNKSFNGVENLLANYIKYTSFENIFKYKDDNGKTILDYAKEDKKFSDFIRNFLIKTIWINFDKNVSVDPIDEYNIIRTKQAIEILYNKTNNFDYYEISFKKFIDEFFKKSKILTSAKVAQELFDKIRINEKNLEKKEQKKFEKVNKNNIGKLPDFEKITELFAKIKEINDNKDKNQDKIVDFLNLIEKSDFI